MSPTLLGLGSNLGDRAANLEAAVIGLGRFLNITSASPIYETAPMYDQQQSAFLNMVVAAETGLAPEPLLDAVKRLERRLGRVPTRRNGPRTIDIDILLFADRVVNSPDLCIPHPGLPDRAFVLVPATDIAPDWACPATGRRLKEMLAALGLTDSVRPYAPPATTTG